MSRRDLDDLEQRAQHAAGDVGRAGNQAVRLVHRQHHRAEIIRLQHRLARFVGAQALFAAQRIKPLHEIFQVLARGGIDDADAFERNVQVRRDFLDFRVVAEHDGRAEPQRVKLPRRLQNARLLAFGENDPLRMPLQFFDDIADETHNAVSSFRFQVASFVSEENFVARRRRRQRRKGILPSFFFAFFARHFLVCLPTH